jgi:hypothetical protein
MMIRHGIAPAIVSAVTKALGIDGIETFRWYDRERLTEAIKDTRQLQRDDVFIGTENKWKLCMLRAWIEHQTISELPITLADFDSKMRDVWLVGPRRFYRQDRI